MKVEIGAGGRTLPGWLGVDINPRRADVIATALRLPFRSGSLDALRAIDLLEHCSYRETDLVLAEWARVVRPGGRIFVQVPDADLIMRWYTQTPEKLTVPPELPRSPLAGAAWRLLGGHADGERVSERDDWRWNAHYALFSKESLTDALHVAGFSVLRCPTNPFPNLQCEAIRT